MSGWYVAYILICIINAIGLKIAGLSLGDLAWWVSVLCVPAAYTIGRKDQ